MSIADIIQKAWLLCIGMGVFGGSLYMIYFRDSHFWRYLGEFYEAPWRRPVATR